MKLIHRGRLLKSKAYIKGREEGSVFASISPEMENKAVIVEARGLAEAVGFTKGTPQHTEYLSGFVAGYVRG